MCDEVATWYCSECPNEKNGISAILVGDLKSFRFPRARRSRKRMSDDLDDGDEHQLDGALLEFMRRFDAGQVDDRERFYEEFPELAPKLRKLLEAADWIEDMAGPTLGDLASGSTNRQRRKPAGSGLVIGRCGKG